MMIAVTMVDGTKPRAERGALNADLEQAALRARGVISLDSADARHDIGRKLSVLFRSSARRAERADARWV